MDYRKEIKWDRETRDYAMYLNQELVGFARTYREAEITLDQLVFELLHAGHFHTATELDGGAQADDIETPTEEQGPCDDINQPIDRARCATCGGEGDCPDCDPIAAIEHQMYLDHLALLDMGFYAACAPTTLLDPDYA